MQVKSLERAEKEGNMYNLYQPVRKTIKERNMNLEDHLHSSLQDNPRVSIKKFKRDNFKRDLQEEEGEFPFPVQAKLGPYEINKVIFGTKNYYWCSCGMSKKQPFCDMSHLGTSFKPIKFSLDEKITNDTMFMCGCKLSNNAPFCDA